MSDSIQQPLRTPPSRNAGERMRDEVRADTPLDKLPLKLKKRKKMAAGIPAVTSSMKHGIKNMGLTRTFKTLTMVNQKDLSLIHI